VAFSSSPIIDLTGYCHRETTEPTSVVACDILRPPWFAEPNAHIKQATPNYKYTDQYIPQSKTVIPAKFIFLLNELSIIFPQSLFNIPAKKTPRSGSYFVHVGIEARKIRLGKAVGQVVQAEM
jgi:hypothetical protein